MQNDHRCHLRLYVTFHYQSSKIDVKYLMKCLERFPFFLYIQFVNNLCAKMNITHKKVELRISVVSCKKVIIAIYDPLALDTFAKS